MSCVEVVAVDSPGEGLYGTWSLSECPDGSLGQLVAQVEDVLCG